MALLLYECKAKGVNLLLSDEPLLFFSYIGIDLGATIFLELKKESNKPLSYGLKEEHKLAVPKAHSIGVGGHTCMQRKIQ